MLFGNEIVFYKGIRVWDEEILSAVICGAESGDTGAQLALARLFKSGKGPNETHVQIDIHKSTEWYKKAADQGDPEAQNELGVAYLNGDGVVRDESKAAELFQLAADNGDKYGQYNLARCYQKGLGVNKDQALAFNLFVLAANQGHKWAQFYAGLACSNGEGTNIDQEAAAKWYIESASGDHSGAAYNLYFRYLNGNGVEKNSEVAHTYLVQAARLGVKKAIMRLADDFASGINGAPCNEEKALRYRIEAANEGDERAIFLVVKHYLDGIGTQQNLDAALGWLNSEGIRNKARAQYNLGLIHSCDKYSCFDLEQAIFHFTRASELEYDLGEAEIAIGDILMHAPEPLGDHISAFRWYKKSAELPYGSYDGMFKVAECHEHGYGVTKDPLEAHRIFSELATYGVGRAQLKVAESLERGLGVLRNYKMAYFWASLAAASGIEDAVTVCNRLERQLTKSQITETQQATANWQPVDPE